MENKDIHTHIFISLNSAEICFRLDRKQRVTRQYQNRLFVCLPRAELVHLRENSVPILLTSSRVVLFFLRTKLFS